MEQRRFSSTAHFLPRWEMMHVLLWILLGALVVVAVICNFLDGIEHPETDEQNGRPFPIDEQVQEMSSHVEKQESFRSKGPLLSAAESAFYRVLMRSIGSGIGVAPKVRLADLVVPSARESRSGWQKDFNRIAMKHADFVLFDQNNGAIIGAIELDDSSHSTLEAGVKDAFKDAVLNSAGIPITRFVARTSYDIAEVRAKIPDGRRVQFAKLEVKNQRR